MLSFAHPIYRSEFNKNADSSDMLVWLFLFHIKLVWRLPEFAFFLRLLRWAHFFIVGGIRMYRLKKRISIMLAIMSLIVLSIVTVDANENITVCLDEQILNFDVPPQIINGRTMVPMRKIFESLGAVVTWDAKTQTATGKKDDTIVNVSINSNILFKNGVPKSLDVAPALIDSRTLVPVRAIAESFDCEVIWEGETQTVRILTNPDFDKGKKLLSASEISERVAPSVFYIEVFDEKSRTLGSGSGFFISSDGVAVTNYHVIENSNSAVITDISGRKFNVYEIIAFDEKLDVAIIKVDKTSTEGKMVSGFPAVTLGNSDEIKAGQKIFALGSPVGLQNTISDGIISNIKQTIGEDAFIQITAPISHGSSGGVLVNEYGEALGVTSAGIDSAQNIGFAIPINIIKLFDINAKGVSYKDFSLNNKQFTLEIYPTTVEIEVGEAVDVFVYAEGKSDEWSILWETEEEFLVDCKWGDWLEEYSSVCPLTITGKQEGVATVTVYSNVDFKGKDITVYIKKPKIETYPSSCTNVPTYTAITGLKPVEYKQYDNNNLYVYDYVHINVVQKYVDYLLANGFSYYDKNEDTDSIAYYYITPEDKIISVVLAHRWNQVWIYVPR